MEAALDMTVAYVKEREQFGQKIAVFQAVQHQVADMATAFTAARHLAWQAITRLAAGSEEGSELEHAAAFVGAGVQAHHAWRRTICTAAPASSSSTRCTTTASAPRLVHPLRAGGAGARGGRRARCSV